MKDKIVTKALTKMNFSIVAAVRCERCGDVLIENEISLGDRIKHHREVC